MKPFIAGIIAFSCMLFNLHADDSWCEPNIDLSSGFPNIKDQDGTGFCSVFAATSLYEYHVCRSTPDNCNRLSTMDAITQTTAFGEDTEKSYWENMWYEEGSNFVANLESIKDNGLCEDHLAAFDDLINTSNRNETWRQLAKQYLKFRRIQKNEVGCDKVYKNAVELVVNNIQDLFLISPPEKEVIEWALQAPHVRGFLNRALVPEVCRSNRIKVPTKVKDYQGDNPLPNSDKTTGRMREKIIAQLMENNPVGIAFNCKDSGICDWAGKSGNHGVVIKGMKKDEVTGQCKFLIHNSWGKGWQASRNGGYVSAEKLLRRTKAINWLAE